MNISNNAIDFNAIDSKSAKINQLKNSRINNSLAVKSFQNDLYVKSDKKANVTNRYVSVVDSYAPRQLLKAYLNTDFITRLIKINPQLQNIMKENGLMGQINPQNVENIMNTHLTTTTAYALNIANQLGISAYDKKLLEQACIFHDFGKVLIPNEVLNKPGELTADEKVIMNLHSELGYQLLSNTPINKRVLNLVRDHHKTAAENADILGQILSVADIYSALREQRIYKQSLSEKEALNILDQKAQKGEVSTEVVEALKKSVISAKAA